MTDRVLTLPDGRLLEVRTTGPAEGGVLVYHHGTPGARTVPRAIERAAHDRGLRVVSWSRPGYGGSTRLPGRDVAQVVEDARAVLTDLGVDGCWTAGWSGGGPHALACAAALPGVRGALVIAGVAPWDADGLDVLDGMGQDNLDEFGAALSGEADLARYLAAQRPALVAATPEGVVGAMASVLPPVDRAVVTDEFGEDLAGSFREAVRVGVDGWLDDDLAFVRPWGFDPAGVVVPIRLWQGEEDLMVPFAHGRWLAAHLPGVEAHLEPGEGHLSIALGAAGRMLDALLAG